MEAHELEGWRWYAAVEPFGPLQDDLRAVLPAVTMANVYRDKKKKHEPFEPRDFLRRLTIEELNEDMIQDQERDPAISVPARTLGRGKTPGQMLQFVEAMFLSKNSAIRGVDNRRQRPRYE